MKESRIPWVGLIPNNWIATSISHFSTSKSGGTPDRTKPEYWEDGDIPWMSSGEVNKGEIYETDEHITALGVAKSSAKLMSPNTVMIALNGQGKTKGMSAILRIASTCNQSLCGFNCDEVHLHYKHLYYCFQAMYKFLRSQAGDDSREGLSAFFVKKQRIPIPPYDEQLIIASYLDKQCSNIDGIIAKLDKRTKILQELKQSIISDIVTKGLDKTAEMQETGIACVGKVPKSWTRHRIKYDLTRSNPGVWGSDEQGDDNDIACFRIADFDYNKGILKDIEPTIRNVVEKERIGRVLKHGDLLIEKSGGGDVFPVGRVVRYNYNIDAVCSNFIHSISVNAEKMNPDFLYYYFAHLYSRRENLLYFNQTTGIQNLKVSAYLGQSMYAPDLSEQEKIVTYLNEKCGEIAADIDKANQQIELLKEYKQALITEVVTGKRKVS